MAGISKKYLKFNIKNVKYALPDASGGYMTADIKSMGGAANMSLERIYSEQEIYADGQVMYILPSDKGLSGTLGLVTLDDDYEIAMGRLMEVDGGLVNIQQLTSKPHAIYFETDGISEDKERITLKHWLFNVTTGAPAENYEQDTENINPQNISLSLKILGVNLKSNTGEDDYVDENGNFLVVTKYTKAPTDAGYTTFGESVPSPKAKGV